MLKKIVDYNLICFSIPGTAFLCSRFLFSPLVYDFGLKGLLYFSIIFCVVNGALGFFAGKLNREVWAGVSIGVALLFLAMLQKVNFPYQVFSITLVPLGGWHENSMYDAEALLNFLLPCFFFLGFFLGVHNKKSINRTILLLGLLCLSSVGVYSLVQWGMFWLR
jgi:hypothetical protein